MSSKSVLDRHADLQAVIADAYKRGAEAMREAAATHVDVLASDFKHAPTRGLYEVHKRIGKDIRGLPIPEDTA